MGIILVCEKKDRKKERRVTRKKDRKIIGRKKM